MAAGTGVVAAALVAVAARATIGTMSGNDKSAQRDSPPVHFF